MNRKRMLLVALALVFGSGEASATCEDIQRSCHDSYILDVQACERNYAGQQKSDCVSRAEQQFNYCVSSVGCG